MTDQTAWYAFYSVDKQEARVIGLDGPLTYIPIHYEGPFADRVGAEAARDALARHVPKWPFPLGTRVQRRGDKYQRKGQVKGYRLTRSRAGTLATRFGLQARVFWPSNRWLTDRKGTSSWINSGALVAVDQPTGGPS